MELLDPPLPEDTKEKVIKLVNIYTQEINFSNEGNISTDPQICTVDNLKMICGVAQNDCAEEMDVRGDVINSQVDTLSPAVQSHWKHYEGNMIVCSNILYILGSYSHGCEGIEICLREPECEDVNWTHL
jgi:hypothetical protein